MPILHFSILKGSKIIETAVDFERYQRMNDLILSNWEWNVCSLNLILKTFMRLIWSASNSKIDYRVVEMYWLGSFSCLWATAPLGVNWKWKFLSFDLDNLRFEKVWKKKFLSGESLFRSLLLEKVLNWTRL